MPSYLEGLRYSFADGAMPITSTDDFGESILELLLNSNGTVKRVLIVKTPTRAGTADVIFPVFNSNGEFQYLVLIQVKNRKENTFIKALSGLDIWQWGPATKHASYLKRNAMFRNVIRVPCCSRGYNERFCQTLNTEWNNHHEYRKYPVVPLHINKRNLNIDVGTNDARGQMAEPRASLSQILGQSYLQLQQRPPPNENLK